MQQPTGLERLDGAKFRNPAFQAILHQTLSRKCKFLVLTNAMKPMMRPRVQSSIVEPQTRRGSSLTLRIGLDHWRHDATITSVVACTLLPYEMQFDLGSSLGDALQPVKLNHPHCSKFCVLGG